MEEVFVYMSNYFKEEEGKYIFFVFVKYLRIGEEKMFIICFFILDLKYFDLRNIVECLLCVGYLMRF